MRVLPLLAAALLLAFAHAREARKGALLIFARDLSGPLVHGRNVTVRYMVRNVGSGPALRVQLRDHSFPASRFEHLQGSFRHTWPSVPADGAASLDVVVTPRRAGTLFVAPPALTYRDPGGEPRVTRLATEDSMAVEDLVHFRRRTDSHRVEWAAYAAAVFALVALPAVTYSVRAPVSDAAKKHQ